MTPEMLAEIERTLKMNFNGTEGFREDEKRKLILDYATTYSCNVFVETGTNRGDTVEAVRTAFAEIYSIEVGPNLYAAAQRRFAGIENVCLLLGDAREVLPDLVLDLLPDDRVIFYLDAHFQYDDASPVGKAQGTSAPTEISAISSLRPDSIVLIDDARLFSPEYYPGEPDLLTLLQDIEALGIWDVELKDDIIRLVPKS